jgi:uncharacterized protein YhhL (DUF1145 family)
MPELQSLITMLIWPFALLALVCNFFYPRTTFLTVLVLGVLYFCVGMVVMEDAVRPMVHFGMMAPFVAVLGSMGIRDLRNYFRGAEAEVWGSAGMAGMYRLWQSYTVTGPKARRFWLLSSIATLGLTAAITGAFTAKSLAGQRYQITDVKQILPDFHKEAASWIRWPSRELRTQTAGESWGDWKPKEGDIGRLVWYHEPKRDAKYVHRIQILEIRDEAESPHYVAVMAYGTSRLRR